MEIICQSAVHIVGQQICFFLVAVDLQGCSGDSRVLGDRQVQKVLDAHVGAHEADARIEKMHQLL